MAFFNSKKHEDMSERGALPPGEYVCEIKKTDWLQNKKKTGYRLSTHFMVVQGDQKGKYIFGNYNLEHENVQTVEISQKEFATLIRAVYGKDKNLNDHSELVGKTVNVKVVIKTSEEYGPSNNITGYEPFNTGSAKKSKGKKGKKGKGKGGKPW